MFEALSAGGAAEPEEPAHDLTLRECLASLDFWLLWLVFGIGAGCGLQLINNLGAAAFPRPRGIISPLPRPCADVASCMVEPHCHP